MLRKVQGKKTPNSTTFEPEPTIQKEAAAWQKYRNGKAATIIWQFTNQDA